MLAQVERAAGDVEAARDRLKRWVALAPDDLSACVELADLALERGEPGKAATVLREVLAVRPNHWEALLLLGDAFNDVGAFTEAARAYQGCVSSNPFCGVAWYNLGQAHLRRGDAERALDALEGYLGVEPEASDRTEVEARIRELREQVGPTS